MKYLGSKDKIARFILPIMMQAFTKNSCTAWVEPFVGGANMIDKVPRRIKRIGNDFDDELVALHKALQDGWVPPTKITEAEYYAMRDETFPYPTPAHVRVFFAITCAFGSKKWASFARAGKADAHKESERNYAAAGSRVLTKQGKLLVGIDFSSGDYRNVDIPASSLIYCDPPYSGTTGYESGDFHHDTFWQWCRDKITEGHTIFVSEYSAPEDFVPVWSRDVVVEFNKTGDVKSREEINKRVEHLYQHKSQITQQ